MAKSKKIFVDYRRFEPADRQTFERLDPTPKDGSLTVDDWRNIPAIHYQNLYEIIGKYQVITRLGRFAHPQLLLVPDGRTLLISSQKWAVEKPEGGQYGPYSPVRDPFGNYLGSFSHGKEPYAACLPHNPLIVGLMEGLFPGLEFTASLRGAEKLAGRIVTNEHGKEPTDFSQPVQWPFTLFIGRLGRHRRLIISRTSSIVDPATQIFLRWGNSTFQIDRNDLEMSSRLDVVDAVDLPPNVDSFDMVLVDHAGNQAFKRYRIVSIKDELFLHEEDERALRDMKEYQLAVASVIDREYKVVDSGKIGVDTMNTVGDLLRLKDKSGFASLRAYLISKYKEQDKQSVWKFVSRNLNKDLQKSEGAKLYSSPEIHGDHAVMVTPLQLEFPTIFRERYEYFRNKYGENVTLNSERVDYIVLRNWLNGDILFEAELANIRHMDQKALLDYYEALSQTLLNAAERYRDKHGMKRGKPLPSHMISRDKVRSYPLLIQGGSKEASKSLPEVLTDAQFTFRIIDTRRDASLTTDVGTIDNPLFHYASGKDLKERPIAIRGEVYRLDIKIPRLLKGTKPTKAVLPNDVLAFLSTGSDGSNVEPVRDQYGNLIFVREDKGKKETSISVLLKPQRARSNKGVETFTTFNIDFSPWVPAIGEIKDIALQEVQRPLAFIGPNNIYAVYSHFSSKRWRQARHTLPGIETQLVEIENKFGLKPGTAIDSVLFQDASEVNASVHKNDPKTVRVWDEMLDSFGNWEGVAWHEAAHSLDFYFKVSQDEQWKKTYNVLKKKVPNFFLFISEKNFLPASGGHPQDSPEELFASMISSLTHPDILPYLRQRASLEPDRSYVELYKRVLSNLLQVLRRKLPAKAPILYEIAMLHLHVDMVLEETKK